VEGSCEHGNEPSGSIKCWEILECHSSGWRLLKQDSATWSFGCSSFSISASRYRSCVVRYEKPNMTLKCRTICGNFHILQPCIMISPLKCKLFSYTTAYDTHDSFCRCSAVVHIRIPFTTQNQFRDNNHLF
jgi:hypothetical protein